MAANCGMDDVPPSFAFSWNLGGMDGHAELAAFLFYIACLAIQVIFDYRCVRYIL
ncbi:MAG: hypothetical protein HUU34_18695 [Saprospiraceae bacterium]|nr:hypothetical protein [Saprospiraceae bacterium]